MVQPTVRSSWLSVYWTVDLPSVMVRSEIGHALSVFGQWIWYIVEETSCFTVVSKAERLKWERIALHVFDKRRLWRTIYRLVWNPEFLKAGYSWVVEESCRGGGECLCVEYR